MNLILLGHTDVVYKPEIDNGFIQLRINHFRYLGPHLSCPSFNRRKSRHWHYSAAASLLPFSFAFCFSMSMP